MSARLLLPLVAFALLLTPALPAQTGSTGAISGTVRDQSQGVVPGATVRVTNVDTSETREALTDERGNYAVGVLNPGRYRVEISMNGFKTVVHESVTVRVTETASLNETLAIASQPSETVTVSAEGEILQTGTTAMGRVVDSE